MTADGSLRIVGARLRGGDVPVDLTVSGGRFIDDPDASAGEVVDAGGGLLLPGFVEAHLHLDKALLGSLGSDGELASAIRKTAEYKRTATADDIRRRASEVIEAEVRAGTTMIRAHTDVDPIIGLVGVDVVLDLKEAYRDLIDIQVVAFPQEGVVHLPGTLSLLRQALERGADVLGGCAYNEPDLVQCIQQIEELFALASEFAVPIDFHADFADDAEDERYSLARHIAETKTRLAFPHEVTIAHLTSLGGMPRPERDAVIADLRAADISVVTLPMTDLHLGGRRDTHSVRRGVTPVAALWSAGVRTACSTNNVRNAFTPYGNADPLETALFLAQVAHLSSPDEVSRVLDSITVVPAQILGMRSYGTAPGDRADFVLLDVRDEERALFDRPTNRRVFKGGRLVATSSSISRLIVEEER